MPLASTAAQSAALDAMWGADHAVSMPSTFEVGLLTGDPINDAGVELAGGGYARVTFTNDGTFWPPAEDGVKTSEVVTLPDATDLWTYDGAWWGIWVADELNELFDCGPLEEPISSSGAGPLPTFTLSVYFDGLTP